MEASQARKQVNKLELSMHVIPNLDLEATGTIPDSVGSLLYENTA